MAPYWNSFLVSTQASSYTGSALTSKQDLGIQISDTLLSLVQNIFSPSFYEEIDIFIIIIGKKVLIHQSFSCAKF